MVRERFREVTAGPDSMATAHAYELSTLAAKIHGQVDGLVPYTLRQPHKAPRTRKFLNGPPVS